MNYADEVCLNYVSTWHDERQALDMRAWHQKGPSLAPVRGKDGKNGKDSNCLHRHVMTPVIYMQKTAKGQGVEHTWTHIWYINLRHSFTSFAKYIYIYYNKYFNSSVNSLLWCKHHSTDSPKRLQMTLLPTTMKCYSKYDHDWLCIVWHGVWTPWLWTQMWHSQMVEHVYFFYSPTFLEQRDSFSRLQEGL